MGPAALPDNPLAAMLAGSNHAGVRSMEYRILGRSGLKVSPLCLGAMMFGGQTDEDESLRIVARAREQGVNFIDTADVYNDGRSEGIVGRAIAAERDWWVLATKIANPVGTGPNARGTSRVHVLRAVEACLRRLGTDSIDILYLHREDHATPAYETVRAIADLVRAGKLRHFGVSNHHAWRVAEICRLADAAGIDRPVVSQPLYNALNRMVETEHLPACAELGLGVFPYSPLARGVLTGKYAAGAAAVAGHPGGAAGQADHGDGVAPRQPAHRPGVGGTGAGARHHARAVRAGLGAEQPAGHRRHRRAAHPGAVGRIRRRAGGPAGRRGRGAGGQSGAGRAPVHARL